MFLDGLFEAKELKDRGAQVGDGGQSARRGGETSSPSGSPHFCPPPLPPFTPAPPPPSRQVRVLTILAIACLIDGDYLHNGGKKKLLREAFHVSGLDLDEHKIARVAHDFANAQNQDTLPTLKAMADVDHNHDGFMPLTRCETAAARTGDCIERFSTYCV